MWSKITRLNPLIYLTGLSVLLFIPFLGNVHLFDWDEINFAECSREMIKMNDYTRVYVDFHPFWEKPPMFFWMQSFSMKIFGITEFAARLPNAVCGIVTIAVVFLCGKKIYAEKFGVYWALAYMGNRNRQSPSAFSRPARIRRAARSCGEMR